MSRVGKQVIAIPAGTEVTLVNGMVSVKGPKGSLTRPVLDNVAIAIEGAEIRLEPKTLKNKRANFTSRLTSPFSANSDRAHAILTGVYWRHYQSPHISYVPRQDIHEQDA
jgi:hypothetical protein